MEAIASRLEAIATSNKKLLVATSNKKLLAQRRGDPSSAYGELI